MVGGGNGGGGVELSQNGVVRCWFVQVFERFVIVEVNLIAQQWIRTLTMENMVDGISKEEGERNGAAQVETEGGGDSCYPLLLPSKTVKL